jgi:hypothetical protein
VQQLPADVEKGEPIGKEVDLSRKRAGSDLQAVEPRTN